MKYCPNCASEEFRLSTPIYYDEGVWKQQKKCAKCDSVVVLRYYDAVERLIYPSGNEILFINDKKKRR